jgi:serine/threonine protein kinase
MAEIMTTIPLFPARNEEDLLAKIFAICGSPSTTVIEYEITARCERCLYQMFENESWSDEMLQILDSLLQIDPKLRPTARELLGHQWFRDDVEDLERILQPQSKRTCYR